LASARSGLALGWSFAGRVAALLIEMTPLAAGASWRKKQSKNRNTNIEIRNKFKWLKCEIQNGNAAGGHHEET